MTDLPARVDEEYARLAHGYDATWSRYNAATSARTLSALTRFDHGGGRIVNVGCGTGPLVGEGRVKTVGLDRSAAMLAVARGEHPGLPLVRGDAARLPFADGSFTAAVTNSALHYLPDPAAAVREIARVLAPGGVLVWTDWDGGASTTRAVVAWLRLTGRPLGTVLPADAMAAAMTAAGFAEVRVDRWRHGLLWGLATASGRKPRAALTDRKLGNPGNRPPGGSEPGRPRCHGSGVPHDP